MFDLRAYEGLARTRYVLDASCVTAAALASLTTATGTATAALAALNVPGGRINLTTKTGEAATVTLPVTFGNSAGSVAAWALEVEGLRTNGERSEVALELAQTNGSGITGLKWDNAGWAVSTTGTATVPTLQAGNFRHVDDLRAGVLVEVPGSSATARATGYVGGTMARTGEGAHASGMISARFRSSGSYSDAASVVSFRRLILTCIWGVAGDPLTKGI